MPSRSHPKPKTHSPPGGNGLRIAAGVVVAALILVIYFAEARNWLSADALREHRDALLRVVSGHYWESLVLVMALCVLLVAVSTPASAPLMLLSGMLFGRWIGSAMMILATSLGAVLAMLLVRYVAQDFVRARLRGHPRPQELVKGFQRHRNSYLLFLRLVPAFPFWITNILVGLTDFPWLPFFLLTLPGIAPDSLIYCNIGANLTHAKSARDLMSPASVAALALLAVLSLTPVALRQLQRRGLIPQGWPFHGS
ncbi:MAG TPA: TVP38/TMEM64 family protein [Gammaproteobacteria bacterium]|jgi:uncharacterized membrane protein YdjX (TVP38/TMEM64 family)